MEPLNDFIGMFESKLTLQDSLVAERRSSYFLLKENMKGFMTENFFYAGTYLGGTKNGKFKPSLIFLAMIAETARNKTYVDEKAEWLFICGRDIFNRGIVKMTGAKGRGNCTLIMNKFDECIGFGRIIVDSQEKANAVAVKNMMDIGDFLRREREKMHGRA